MKAISSLVNVDSIDNDKNLEGGFSAESIVMPNPDVDQPANGLNHLNVEVVDNRDRRWRAS